MPMKIKQNIIQKGRIFQITTKESSGSGKTNALLNLIHTQLDIDKIYLYVKDPYETKFQFLIKKRESRGILMYRHFNDPKGSIEYSNNIQDVYKKK